MIIKKSLLETLEKYKITAYVIAVHALNKHYSATSRTKKSLSGESTLNYVDLEKICKYLNEHTSEKFTPEEFVKETVRVRV